MREFHAFIVSYKHSWAAAEAQIQTCENVTVIRYSFRVINRHINAMMLYVSFDDAFKWPNA